MYDNINRDLDYVIVTGGSSGIGESITRQLLISGYGVISLSPNAESYSLELDNYLAFNCDVSSEGELRRCLAPMAASKLNVTKLVNNAGYSCWKPLMEVDESFLSLMISKNIATAVFATKVVLSMFQTLDSIVNVSSLAGKRGTANNSIYVGCKFAINGITQAWCKELGKLGIRVNAVCPVLIRTPGLDYALSQANSPIADDNIDGFLQKFSDKETALGYLPTSDDVAQMVQYLLSPMAKAVTGQCINIDCGVLPG